ncbi:hypothetical protein [Metabacillus malikii]|uniref:Membrane protein n=1 Tax=Metabacillus malikii TaxID=1504265 RepID=A0ABT9ZHR6_9BACI|nr:hypothetical protein [Metabacillus malikii]MDQ0231351.1 putative membrane protein [Metabacillus malikii]
MKRHTLIEYCLLIFFSGIYFAFLGFQSKGFTFIIGVIFLYVLINIATKRMLPSYIQLDKKVGIWKTVSIIIGSVFLTMLVLTILVM